MAIQLDKDIVKQAVASIQRYFQHHAEQTLGNLEAESLLQFFVEEIGPCIYNAAIADAQSQMSTRVAELDIDCYQKPFSFWAGPAGRGR